MPTQHSPSNHMQPPHNPKNGNPKQSSMDSFLTVNTPKPGKKSKRAREDNKTPENNTVSAPMSIEALAALLLPKLQKLDLLEEINETLVDIKNQLLVFESRVEALEQTVATQAQQIASLIKEKDKLQDELRRPNLLIHGLPEIENDQNPLHHTIQSLFQSKLGLDVDIDSPFRLGKPCVGKTRPVKVRFTRLSHRSAVFEKRLILRNYPSKIAITEDLALSTRLERKLTWEKKYKNKDSELPRSRPPNFNVDLTSSNNSSFDQIQLDTRQHESGELPCST